MRTWGEIKELAEPNKTLCDYDHTLPSDLRQRVRAVRRIVGARPVSIRLDRTARGFHMVIRWDRTFSKAQIVALQAALGSDPLRELLNLARADATGSSGVSSRYWNVLYARKLPSGV